MAELKTIIVVYKETFLDQFEKWDAAHNYPKTRSWTERVCGREFNAYNDTYGEEDSFAKYIGDDFFNFWNNLVDGTTLSTDCSVFDRMLCGVHSEYPAGMGYEDDKYGKFRTEYRAKQKESADLANEAFDSIKKVGDFRKVKIVDFRNPNHVTEISFLGSADFPDLTDEVKKHYGRKWYKRWYDENKERGLIEFDFSLPSEMLRKTNRDAFAKNTLEEVLEKFSEAVDGGFDGNLHDWLDSFDE